MLAVRLLFLVAPLTVFGADEAYGPCLLSTDCTRECVAGAPPRICKYVFNVERYQTMGMACGNCSNGVISDCYNPGCVTADGRERAIITVNRQLPGTPIEVCFNDWIVVDVVNRLDGMEETMHWHGMLQFGTASMDGVPMVTQYPILAGTSFRYQFKADSCGTFFYHSHSGLKKMDGDKGPLVIRKPVETDVHGHLYDTDLSSHVITLSDWLPLISQDYFPGLRTTLPPAFPDSVLINGRGQYTNASGAVTTQTPIAEFIVTKGLRHRFRIINAGSTVCPLIMTIEGHRLKVISVDKDPCRPVTFDSVILFSGERLDMVVESDQPPGAYWISVRALGLCSIFSPASQVALLVYEGSEGTEPTHPRPSAKKPLPQGLTLGHPAMNCSTPNTTCPHQLRYDGLRDISWCHKPPHQRLTFGLGFHRFDWRTFFKSPTPLVFRQLGPDIIEAATINNKSYISPDRPLLSHGYDEDRLCTSDHTQYEQCTHIVELEYNKTYDILFYDDANEPPAHPMHTHGHAFLVQGAGLFESGSRHTFEEVSKLHESGLIPRNDCSGPMKDVITSPTGGYTMITLHTNNPGYWLVHCHFQLHMMIGMMMVFHVPGHNDIPENFPKCGSFSPPIMPYNKPC